MHVLQPKHAILKKEEISKLLEKYNISLIQLPKIKITDPALPENVSVGDVIKIERKEKIEGEEDQIHLFYRVVII